VCVNKHVGYCVTTVTSFAQRTNLEVKVLVKCTKIRWVVPSHFECWLVGLPLNFLRLMWRKWSPEPANELKQATFFRTNQAWCSCRQKVPTLLLTYVKAPCSRTHLLKTNAKVYPLQSDAGAFDMMSSAKASGLTFRDHITSVASRGHLRAMQLWRCFYV